jgi:NAD+ synthase (glutamine-hydrolysing)
MKIGLAQINTTVGDIAGNSELILGFQERAEAAGCGLVIYPELAVTGYPPRDLVEKRALVADNLRAVERIAARVRTAAVLGFVDRNPAAVGKPLCNAAALLSGGGIAAVYHKALLPTYDVFDEGRYFAPGSGELIFERGGLRFGVTICEDLWSRQMVDGRQLYRADPLDRLADTGLDFLINISASPFSLGKEEVRRQLAARRSGGTGGVIYLNLVGGNDELVFDGSSFVLDRTGRLAARAHRFAEDLVVFDSDLGSGEIREEADDDMTALEAALTLGLQDYVAKCGFGKVILGLSGGIDSAVVAALAARALGPGNVVAVLMPSAVTGDESIEDATRLARNLGLATFTLPIQRICDGYLDALREAFAGREVDATEENIQARVRGNLLMALSNKFGWLLVNTGNKSELAMGYCTLYGDMTGGLSVIGDVPKTLVYPLGRRLNGGRETIPERIFTKAPSAELRPGQKDEDSLPPYASLDPILKLYIEENLDYEDIVAAGHPPDLVADIIDRVDRNEYKRRQAPPVLRITGKAFGIGRRLPIAQRYRHRRTPE